VRDAARCEAPLAASGQLKAAERDGVCMHPVAVASEDLGDLPGPQQADLTAGACALLR
jgi:hypothetical protein